MNSFKTTETYRNFVNGIPAPTTEMGVKCLKQMLRDADIPLDNGGEPYYAYIGKMRINYWPICSVACGPTEMLRVPEKEIKRIKLLTNMRVFCDLLRAK